MELEHTVLVFIVLAFYEAELVLIRNNSFACLGNGNLSVEHNACVSL